MREDSDVVADPRGDPVGEPVGDPQAIRADIAETRERMSSTLEEIGERLNPQTLKNNVKDSIRDATIGRVNHMARIATNQMGRATDTVTKAVRENPIPAALIAIGIGWLVWNARTTTQQRRTYNTQDTIDADEGFEATTRGEYGAGLYAGSYENSYAGYSPSFGTAYGSTAGSEPRGVGEEGPQGIRGRVRDRARDLGGSASRRAERLAERARGAAGTVRDRTRQMASTVADTTRRGAGRVEDAYNENPLALGAVAVAAGLATGFAAPISDREVRWMGSTRDDVVDRVREFAEETREKVERVATRVAEDAKVVAREEGLTPPTEHQPT